MHSPNRHPLGLPPRLVPTDKHNIEHTPLSHCKHILIEIHNLLVPHKSLPVPDRRTRGVHSADLRPPRPLGRLDALVAAEQDELVGSVVVWCADGGFVRHEDAAVLAAGVHEL